MGKAAKQKKQQSAKSEKTDDRLVPDFRDEKGRLVKLVPKDFPRTDAGKMAYFDYQVTKWTERKKKFERRNDPNAKLLRQIESKERGMAKQMLALEELKATMAAAQKS